MLRAQGAPVDPGIARELRLGLARHRRTGPGEQAGSWRPQPPNCVAPYTTRSPAHRKPLGRRWTPRTRQTPRTRPAATVSRVFGDVSQIWRRNHPWAAVYDFVVERERLARPLGLALFGTDMARLYESAERAIGEVPAGSSILDIPCGGGVALRGLDPGRQVRYVAADIAPAMLKRTSHEAARRGLGQVELVEADIEALPFAAGDFELCLTFTGLHCVPHPRVAVTELARCTAPDGRIVGSWFATDSGAVYEPARLLGRAAGLLGPSCGVAELSSWLAQEGFGEIDVQTSGAIAHFSARRIRPT